MIRTAPGAAAPGPAPLCSYELPSPGVVAAWNPRTPLVAVGCADGTVVLLEWSAADASLAPTVSVSLPELAPLVAITWCVDGFFLRCQGDAGEERFLSLGDDGELPQQLQWAPVAPRSHDGRHRADLEASLVRIFEA